MSYRLLLLIGYAGILLDSRILFMLLPTSLFPFVPLFMPLLIWKTSHNINNITSGYTPFNAFPFSKIIPVVGIVSSISSPNKIEKRRPLLPDRQSSCTIRQRPDIVSLHKNALQ